jgi:hypothetical protein
LRLGWTGRATACGEPVGSQKFNFRCLRCFETGNPAHPGSWSGSSSAPARRPADVELALIEVC